MSPANFLQQYFDPALEPPSAGNREELETREVDRIERELSIVLVASMMPRRLGGDATDDDLALDKRRAKRVSHALIKSRAGWTKKRFNALSDEEIRRLGAQLDWNKWLESHIWAIEHELRCLATWAVHHDELRWGRSAVVRLANERNWVTYGMRD